MMHAYHDIDPCIIIEDRPFIITVNNNNKNRVKSGFIRDYLSEKKIPDNSDYNLLRDNFS